MPFYSISSLIIFLSIINYISSEIRTNEQPIKNHETLIRGIDSRRSAIQYVMNSLSRMDRSLADLEQKIKQNRDLSKRCIADECETDSAGELTKQAINCQLFGIGCGNTNRIVRKKREDLYDTGTKPKCTPVGGEPAGDCDNNGMDEESQAQEWLKQGAGHRNPGK